MKQLGVKVSEELYELIARAAASEDRTVAAWVRRLIRLALEREETT
jgi:predicted HicB family RNase H-like nuclease